MAAPAKARHFRGALRKGKPAPAVGYAISRRREFRYLHELVSIIAGVVILLVNFLFISVELPFLAPLVNVAGGLIAVVPSIWIFYSRYRRAREIEAQFVTFVHDLTDAINSGMTLPLALDQTSRRNYFSLSPLVKDMAAQVEWGIPFKQALEIFAKRSGSTPVRRAVTTIIETYKVGGKISDTLNAIGESLLTINRIKEERSASVHAQIVTSYLIFFVFIAILVILQTFLIPALSPPAGLTGGVITSPTAGLQDVYNTSFINFIIIQGFFAGLVTGKMAEGSIVAGFKHSILLIVVGYTIFSMASQFQFGLFSIGLT